MKRFLRISCILLLSGTAFSMSTYYFWYKSKFQITRELFTKSPGTSPEEFVRLSAEASVIKKFAAPNHYNATICFLVDMKIASGRKRFFVYDLQRDSILLSGLVAHGSCDKVFQIEAAFSNKINSGCSCLGKFSVGKSYNGRFGISYKLFGLDSSNGNAYKRAIVLHSYDCVPEEEIYPLPVCNSRGCAMVSAGFLQQLRPYIERSAKPVILKLFY